MPYPNIPALPDVPNRLTDSPQQFSNRVDAFLSSLPNFRVGVNDSGAWIMAQQETLEGLVIQAQEQVGLAAQQATNAAESAQEAESFSQIAVNNANFKGRWDVQSGAAEPAYSVFWVGQYWQLLESVSDITQHEPGVSGVWAVSASVAGRTVIDGSVTLDFAGRYYIDGNHTITLGSPVDAANGARYDFAWSVGSEPSFLTVADGFNTDQGMSNEIIADRRAAIEFVSLNDKWEL